MTDKDAALAAMYRVLKPGGRLVLEFKPVFEPFSKLYDLYSFTALPIMGKIIANDSDKYLAESIRMHPAPLKGMMENAGSELLPQQPVVLRFTAALRFVVDSGSVQLND